MPAGDWRMLVGLVIGIIAVFVAVIVLGLRFATRNQAKILRQARASDVLAGIGLGNMNRAALLYGVWQTTMTEVILRVRDGNDTDVASIVHRAAGATITAGEDPYTVVVTSGWRESATLIGAGDRAQPPTTLCTFDLRGWGGGRLARYTLPDRRVLSIRARWSISWKPAPLPIIQGDRTIGQLFAIGAPTYSTGRAVVLPSSIPLPIRLFILYKATGSRTMNSVR